MSYVVSSQDLVLPVSVDDNIIINKSYTLLATINNSDSLNNGHYTAYIKHCGKWIRCND